MQSKDRRDCRGFEEENVMRLQVLMKNNLSASLVLAISLVVC
jgi:hypothetical protein